MTLVDKRSPTPTARSRARRGQPSRCIGAQAVSSIPAGVRPPTLRFEGGNLAVDTGCNTGRGRYALAGDTITFGPIATTRMACVDPNGQRVEQAVLTVLTGTATSAIDGPVLTLTERHERAPAAGRTPPTAVRRPRPRQRHDDDIAARTTSTTS